MNFVIATFYHFVEISNYHDMKDEIQSTCSKLNLKGTILLAEEGINATISGERKKVLNLFEFLNSDHRFNDLTWKENYADYQPFNKMKVRLKKEIVNLGIDELDLSLKGEYIEPENWDNLISQPDVLLVDTRNIYEVKLGKFKHAVDPQTKCFRDFPKWANSLSDDKNTKIAMYCTGGVRCEKSTAYMRSIGFKNVYHLKGGILSYLAKNRSKNNMWKGECFVFDDRVAVDNLLKPSNEIACIFCSNQVSTEELKSVSRGQVICFECQSQHFKM